MNCTIRDLKENHNYILISADPEQTQCDIYHVTLDELHIGSAAVYVSFVVKEFENETYNKIAGSKVISDNPDRVDNADESFDDHTLTLDSVGSGTDGEYMSSKIHKVFHRLKSMACDKYGKPCKGWENAVVYDPRKFIICETLEDGINSYERYLNNLQKKHKKEIDHELEVYQVHEMGFAEQIMSLRLLNHK